jgi:hypothetical protein
MKPLHSRKFITAVRDRYRSIRSIIPKSKPIDADQLSVSTISTSFHMESELFSSEFGDTVDTPTPSSTITIRYLHCKNLFIFDAKEKCILNVNPTTNSLLDLYKMIASQQDITEDFKLELYFSEGYPLDLNDHTIAGMYLFIDHYYYLCCFDH